MRFGYLFPLNLSAMTSDQGELVAVLLDLGFHLAQANRQFNWDSGLSPCFHATAPYTERDFNQTSGIVQKFHLPLTLRKEIYAVC
jgi:hypothetical protein